jgi:hypothetical protein
MLFFFVYPTSDVSACPRKWPGNQGVSEGQKISVIRAFPLLPENIRITFENSNKLMADVIFKKNLLTDAWGNIDGRRRHAVPVEKGYVQS